MKTTIDIPGDLYRKVKARCALEGRPVREVPIELFRQWLGESPAPSEGRPFVSAYDLMRDLCGALDSGVDDLASNPAHIEGLGRDSLGDR
ncbi:MAG: hypothetical protein HY690_05855 [Chloroflexi bacterium]|nr:hypothetical protein [Chloroflexota bacterium]